MEEASHNNNSQGIKKIKKLKKEKREMGNLKAILIAFFASAIALQACSVHATLSDSTNFYWGETRGKYTGPDSVDLVLTEEGGTGIRSNVSYMYGSITLGLKLPSGNSAGTVTTFYLSSANKAHDEIDFEFLGNTTGEPYTIHTNIFTQGNGSREQQFKPWFNPSDGYHFYTIFWNTYAVVWMVDGVPIRVFKNFHDSQINFPDAQPMNTYSSFWNADDWATQKGAVKTDWSLAPFTASLENYNVDGCYCWNTETCVETCSNAEDSANWWTQESYTQLSDSQKQQMTEIRNNYMIYNYCTDYSRFNAEFPRSKECDLAQY
ncbi:probable xyloglucan endotransglucosylase/hydrolase protein 26 [Chenopodium quinoa]|uniref:probable xyloglucan endotransglucosylase/hydrolase protein 26 n=1 Tax=Chenopodium quinoa TaxID=63459 RepID=UPI000B772FA8|nr:probable xyloglucan endotransglucosylase/hydrolase protein 26 [Chenopodium quinoa]